MATVFEGLHARLRVAVAVKVITASEPGVALSEALAREIRAIAALCHPGIVTVHDYGLVERACAHPSGLALAEGTPYLVTDRADGGTLRQLIREPPPPSWAEVRESLLAILDALAHAHGRGVIHCDIKPSNVLVTRSAHGARALGLTDFGIARRLDDHRTQRSRAGTPAYMAPEQILGGGAPIGPWTDLYAVGCIACTLVRGAPPFERGPAARVLEAHLVQPPPLLEASATVPAGFDDWLARMLDKRPSRRYRRAADAAFGLIALGDPPEEVERDSRLSSPRMSTLGDGVADSSTLAGVAVTEPTRPVEPVAAQSATGGGPGRAPVAPLRAHWWSAESGELPPPMAGVGLGLFGLREVPMLGRGFERDVLWSSLRRAADGPRPELVVLRGPPGTGKSRLAAWLCERAHELGAARPMHAHHGAAPGPGDGLLAMFERALGAAGVHDEAELAQRVAAELDGLVEPTEIGLVASVIAFFRDARRSRGGDSDRRALLARLLRALGRERPLVVWIDDAHYGLEALELCEFVLDHAPDIPVLFVATVRSDQLDGRPEEAAWLARRDAEATTLDVEPLGRAEHERLVRWLLGLEDSLVERVVDRTEGHPLFAVQLVGDWVQREILVPGERGFALRPGADVSLPDDIHALWTRRVAHLEALFEGDTGRCLEVAAALGHEVTAAQWERACGYAGLEIPAGLEAAMLEARLAVAAPAGLSFSHSMLRESLERRARAAGRWPSAHRACARALAELHPDDPEAAESIAVHWERAGEAARALEPLARATRHALLKARGEHARELSRRRARLLDASGVTEPDARWADHFIDAAWAHRLAGELDDLERALDRAEANDPGHPEAAFRRADLRWLRGEPAHESLPALRAARAEARARAKPELEVRIASKLAAFTLDLGRGRDDGVEAMLTDALASAEAQGSATRQVGCLAQIARAAQQAGDLDRGVTLFERAAEIARAAGHSYDIWVTQVMLGVGLACAGDPDRAIIELQSVLRLADAGGAGPPAVGEVFLAQAEILAERWEDALARVERLGRDRFVADTRLAVGLGYVRLPCEARRGRWGRYEAAAAVAERHLPATGHASLINALCAARSLADARAGAPALARRVEAVVEAQRAVFGPEAFSRASSDACADAESRTRPDG